MSTDKAPWVNNMRCSIFKEGQDVCSKRLETRHSYVQQMQRCDGEAAFSAPFRAHLWVEWDLCVPV